MFVFLVLSPMKVTLWTHIYKMVGSYFFFLGQVEEIREYFQIANDFTPEEEAAVRAENKWADQA
jgi:Skp1 family, dimerisation domain